MYRSTLRRESAAQTRATIITAARALLTAGNLHRFTIDAVAEAAGIARMTIYHQFGSKQGLIEAVGHDVAAKAGFERAVERALKHPDPISGLQGWIEAQMALWASHRALMKRLFALVTLETRDGSDPRGGRYQGLRKLLERLTLECGRPLAEEVPRLADLIMVLTSFEAYETLAGAGHSRHEVANIVWEAARKLLDI